MKLNQGCWQRSFLFILVFVLLIVPGCYGQAAGESTFRIKPLRPVEELRKEALAAQPPKEPGNFRKPELVELISLDPTIKLDIRYATDNNFLSTPMYSQGRAFLQKPRPRRWYA